MQFRLSAVYSTIEQMLQLQSVARPVQDFDQAGQSLQHENKGKMIQSPSSVQDNITAFEGGLFSVFMSSSFQNDWCKTQLRV